MWWLCQCPSLLGWLLQSFGCLLLSTHLELGINLLAWPFCKNKKVNDLMVCYDFDGVVGAMQALVVPRHHHPSNQSLTSLMSAITDRPCPPVLRVGTASGRRCVVRRAPGTRHKWLPNREDPRRQIIMKCVRYMVVQEVKFLTSCTSRNPPRLGSRPEFRQHLLFYSLVNFNVLCVNLCTIATPCLFRQVYDPSHCVILSKINIAML